MSKNQCYTHSQIKYYNSYELTSTNDASWIIRLNFSAGNSTSFGISMDPVVCLEAEISLKFFFKGIRGFLSLESQERPLETTSKS